MISVLASAALAGVISGFGPCLSARFLAIAGSHGRVQCAWTLLCMTLGTWLGLSLLAFSLETFYRLTLWSWCLNDGIAVCALIYSVRILMATHRCFSSDRHDSKPGSSVIVGFVLGILGSPCCAPLLLPIIAQARTLEPVQGWLLLGVFALAQSIPLALTVSLRSWFSRFLQSHRFATAVQTISGSLFLALGALILATA